MIKIILFSLLSLIATFIYAAELAADCGIVRIQIEQLGGEKVLRDMGLGSIIDGCKKEESAIHLASFNQTASCRSDDKDKFSINNNKKVS